MKTKTFSCNQFLLAINIKYVNVVEGTIVVIKYKQLHNILKYTLAFELLISIFDYK